MRIFVLELVAMVSFVVAGWLVSPSLGLAVFGVLCAGTAFALSRSVGGDK